MQLHTRNKGILFDLQGIEPQPEEVDMIVLFDSVAMKIMQEEHKRKLPKEKGKRIT